jgi:hypothetical protein
VVVPDSLGDPTVDLLETGAPAGENVRARGGAVDVGHAARDAVRPAVVARSGADGDSERGGSAERLVERVPSLLGPLGLCLAD